MRQLMLLGLLVTLFRVSQCSLIDFANQLPACGLSCITEQIPLSACQTVTNDTCICSNQDLKNNVQVCLLARCSRLEAIDVARIEAKACNRPVRKRKIDILAPLAIQIVGFLAVPLRLYARWTTMHRFETDDWIMIVCWFIFIVFVTLGQLAGALAFGEDIWMVTPDELTFALKVFFVDESFYLTCLGLTKISVLFFYLRIFPNKPFRWATYATMAYIIVSTTVLLFMTIFQCIPFEYNWVGWKGDFGPHQCLDINTLAFVAGGLSISHDVIILILPLPLLYHLNMGMRKKVGIFIMFSLGVFILITSCVRLQYIVLFTQSLNPTWDFTDPLVWSGVEVSVSMIVVCLPALRTLLNRVTPNVLGSPAATADLRPKPSVGSSGVSKSTDSKNVRGNNGNGNNGNNPNNSFYENDDHHSARETARAANLADKRRNFFMLRSRNSEPNESEIELGDRSRGEVRTDIGYGEGEPGTRRSSIESGIHVQTTMTFHDMMRESRRTDVDKSTF